tara:strand:- start:9749 stop:10405 length:657 start_codon:yes stop_codon:yes gene_type:complete
MKNLIIIGASGHAAEAIDYINFININSINPKYNIVGLVDNTEHYYKHYGFKYKFLGNANAHVVDNKIHYVIGIGDINIRKKVIDEYIKKGAKFETIIHPTALVSKTAKIGNGSLISHNVSIGPMAKIGKFCVLNSRSTIGHDSEMGDNNFISPNVVLGGFSKLGNNNMLGTNSCLTPKIIVGNNNKIVAGMTILNNVHDNETIFYRFKEKLVIRNNNE